MSDPKRGKSAGDTVKEQTVHYGDFERYEIIGGIRYEFLSSPQVVHQMISAEIEQHLRRGCQMDGVVLDAPIDVHLDENHIVQPDILYISNDRLHIIVDQKIKGTPDLLVEILSPGTGHRDKVIKKELYERFRVKEYWIVDPVHFTVDQFVLQAERLLLHKVYSHGATLTSPCFPCIEIDMDDLYQRVERFMPKE